MTSPSSVLGGVKLWKLQESDHFNPLKINCSWHQILYFEFSFKYIKYILIFSVNPNTLPINQKGKKFEGDKHLFFKQICQFLTFGTSFLKSSLAEFCF